jgi:hypothetical protein
MKTKIYSSNKADTNKLIKDICKQIDSGISTDSRENTARYTLGGNWNYLNDGFKNSSVEEKTCSLKINYDSYTDSIVICKPRFVYGVSMFFIANLLMNEYKTVTVDCDSYSILVKNVSDKTTNKGKGKK